LGKGEGNWGIIQGMVERKLGNEIWNREGKFGNKAGKRGGEIGEPLVP